MTGSSIRSSLPYDAFFPKLSVLPQDVPNAGMFISNCAHHVSLANPTTWAEMPVPALDSTNTVTDITLNKVKIIKIYFHDVRF